MRANSIRKVYSFCLLVIIILSSITTTFHWAGVRTTATHNPLTTISTITGSMNGDNFGWNVSWLGDINGDGYEDLIVGAPHTDSNSSAWPSDWWNANWT